MHQRILLTKFGQNWTFGYGARGRMPEERRKKEETGQIQDLSRSTKVTRDFCALRARPFGKNH